MLGKKCPLCGLLEAPLVLNELAGAVFDGYPISQGHTLVIPFRHFSRLDEASPEEVTAIFTLVPEIMHRLQKDFSPQGFNVGLNDGVAAGQTVPHLHVHVIPRFDGDHPDPRGGIRFVIPEKARYWKS